MKRTMAIGIGVLLTATLWAAVVQDVPSSRAYVGHEKDTDMKTFIRRYRGVASKR